MRYLLTYISPDNPKWNQQWIVSLEKDDEGTLIERGYVYIGKGPCLPGAPRDWQNLQLKPYSAVASYADDPHYTLKPLEAPAPQPPPDDDYDLLNDFPY